MTSHPTDRPSVARFDKPLPGGSGAFTLVEVLVVIVMIVIIALWVIPIGRSPPPTAVPCLSNLKQMTLAWLLYASDYQDRLVANQPYLAQPGAPRNNWVGGVMDWSADPQNTNQRLLLEFGLSPYLKSAGVYHCPADDSVSAAGPRVRSYSMNAFASDSANAPSNPGWKQFRRLSGVSQPTSTFVFVDEHANSIDDGYFVTDPALTNAWVDLPSSRHNGAAGFSFADGHSEVHRWYDDTTKQPSVPNGPKPKVRVRPPNDRDLLWVLQRATEPQTNRANGF